MKSAIDMQVRSLADARARLADYFALTKPRITLMVVLTAGAGYYLGAIGAVDIVDFAQLLIGTALSGAGASTLNQYLERELDTRMVRTRDRPLPAGRLAPREALVLGLILSAGGVFYLWIATNALTALLSAATVASYVLGYTPLKRVSTLNTIVGAVPGALPPLGGWAAARGDIGIGGVVLFGILFLWQLPHFLAIAWLYRHEYAKAGMWMLPCVDPSGRLTGRQVIVWTLALVPASLMPAAVGLTGAAYFFGALVLGVAFAGFALSFARSRTNDAARRVLLYSVIYLPCLLALMVIDKGGVAF